MNIYKARNLQKMLYKYSGACFRRMRCKIIDGILYYLIWHRLSNNATSELDITDITRMTGDLENGILIRVEYVNNTYNIPEGMYVIELIPVD